MPVREYAPECMIALREELPKHPELYKLCQAAPDFETCMAEIAAYCNILLDGMYKKQDLVEMLVKKLKEKDGNNVIYVRDPRMVEVQVKQTKDSIIIDSAVPPTKKRQ